MAAPCCWLTAQVCPEAEPVRPQQRVVLRRRQPAHDTADGAARNAAQQREVLGPDGVQRGDILPQPWELQEPEGGAAALMAIVSDTARTRYGKRTCLPVRAVHGQRCVFFGTRVVAGRRGVCCIQKQTYVPTWSACRGLWSATMLAAINPGLRQELLKDGCMPCWLWCCRADHGACDELLPVHEQQGAVQGSAAQACRQHSHAGHGAHK